LTWQKLSIGFCSQVSVLAWVSMAEPHGTPFLAVKFAKVFRFDCENRRGEQEEAPSARRFSQQDLARDKP
jgi:hypothetical protein